MVKYQSEYLQRTSDKPLTFVESLKLFYNLRTSLTLE